MTMLLTSIAFAVLSPTIIAAFAVVHHHWHLTRTAAGLGQPVRSSL
jgi:hypothetical protein